jgi:hypothetical protein
MPDKSAGGRRIAMMLGRVDIIAAIGRAALRAAGGRRIQNDKPPSIITRLVVLDPSSTM